MQRCDKTLNCGESPDDARFCIDCGAVLGATGPTVVLQQPAGPPARDHSSGLSLQTATAGTTTQLPVPVGISQQGLYWRVFLCVMILGFLLSYVSSYTLEAAMSHPGGSFMIGAAASRIFARWLKIQRPIPFLLLLGGAWGLMGWMLHVILLAL